jgi:hypothetical protein
MFADSEEDKSNVKEDGEDEENNRDNENDEDNDRHQRHVRAKVPPLDLPFLAVRAQPLGVQIAPKKNTLKSKYQAPTPELDDYELVHTKKPQKKGSNSAALPVPEAVNGKPLKKPRYIPDLCEQYEPPVTRRSAKRQADNAGLQADGGSSNKKVKNLASTSRSKVSSKRKKTAGRV